MSNPSLIDVIEQLLEADMTKPDQVKNPQEEENDEELEEAQDVETGQASPEDGDNKAGEVHDGDTIEPSADQDSADAEPDKPSAGDEEMSDEGGDKSTGGGDETAEVEADQASHDQESDNIEGPAKPVAEESEETVEEEVEEVEEETAETEETVEEETEEEATYEEVDPTEVSDAVQEVADELEATLSGEKVEEGQDTSIDKNANDEMLPDQDKETLDAAQEEGDNSAEVSGSHDQGNDDIEDTTAKPVAEEESVEEEAEEVEEAKVEEDEVEELTAAQKKLPAGLQKAIKDKEEQEESVEVAEDKAADVKAAAEMYMKDDSCTYEMAAEKYGCTKEEVKKACEMYKEEAEEVSEAKPDFLDLDKDGDKEEPMAAAADDKKEEEVEEAVAEEEIEEEVDLDEDFKTQAAVVFETAVNEKVSTLREEIEAEYATKFEDDKADLEEKFNEFVDYAVKEWLEENQLEVKYSLRTEIAENFIQGMKSLFEENYIDIPEEEVSVVDELTEAVEGYKDRISEQDEMLEKLQTEILTFTKGKIVEDVTDGLTDTQKIRLEKLSESVEATDTEEFREKLETLKEAYFDSPDRAAQVLSSLGDEVYSMSESGEATITEDSSPVSQYAKFLSKTVLK